MAKKAGVGATNGKFNNFGSSILSLVTDLTKMFTPLGGPATNSVTQPAAASIANRVLNFYRQSLPEKNIIVNASFTPLNASVAIATGSVV